MKQDNRELIIEVTDLIINHIEKNENNFDTALLWELGDD